MSYLQEVLAERDRLRHLLADVAASDVAHDVAQLPYVTVLIERDLWDQVRSPDEWHRMTPVVPGPR